MTQSPLFPIPKTQAEIDRENNPNLVQVESFTTSGTFYEVDKIFKTCTCPAFGKGRGKVFCKHLNKIFGVEESKSPVSFSVWQSNLQKAVRRCNPELAVISAREMMLIDPFKLCRRLFVIVVEDAFVHPGLIVLVDLIKKYQRINYVTDEMEKDVLMGIAWDAANVRWREDWDMRHKERQALDRSSELDPESLEARIVGAIKYRSVIGGMKGDIRLLETFARVWSSRFASGEWTADKLLTDVYDKYKELSNKKVRAGTKADIMPEAIDFHCWPPMLKILLKKEYIVNAVAQEYPGEDIELRLRNIIWRCRSSFSDKIAWTTGAKVEWLTYFDKETYNYTEDDLIKYKRIYSQIERDVEGLSGWYLKKMGDKS